MTEQQELELDAAYEREVADTEEGERLLGAIHEAMQAYWRYLDDHGLIWKTDAEMERDSERDPTKGENPAKCDALVAEITVADWTGTEVRLVGGAIDRLNRPSEEEVN